MYNQQKGRERSRRRWGDDVAEWCNSDLYILSEVTAKWRLVVQCAVDTEGHWALTVMMMMNAACSKDSVSKCCSAETVDHLH